MDSIRPDSGRGLELLRKRSSVTSKGGSVSVSVPTHTSVPRSRQQNNGVTIDLDSEDEDEDCLLLSPRSSSMVRGESSSKRTRIPVTLNLLGRQALSNDQRRNEQRRHGTRTDKSGSFLGLNFRPPTVDLTSPTPAPSDDCEFLSEFRGNTKRQRLNGGLTQPVNALSLQQPIPEKPREASLMCVVCMDTMKESSTTVCGHVFCKQCIMDAIKAQKKCPTCRKKLSASQVHRIYLNSAVV